MRREGREKSISEGASSTEVLGSERRVRAGEVGVVAAGGGRG